ncbi:MAG: tryptophan--tRNA ligase [Candidatus Cloacimonetes bacterium]|nr:tryptophan--tRNA ligase [Candidatus Cloacimonadota bacterium]MCF7813937.1 tryptophan--tRNA ligase [Candidatus Cloacimonadota bacterium]MCF7868031.1 tryptophan--tRNA ligase [Candidatus Cloacimonadota bacterium]MCF7883951.1 tryptophan--tRNA ligase [Candidatus Cloacimonadota bacterium]
MAKKIALTGIKPTGLPHIGNFFGMYKPALELAEDYDTRYFIADYHALNSMKDPKLVKELSYEVAATWLAMGLNPKESILYKQSAVQGTFELTTFLMAFTSKGLMNRAHSYKAKVQENTELGKDPDDGVNMGLFTYPVLMAADILQFDSDVVPVGKDQAQHLEMAVDIAQSINHNYGKELLKIPKALIKKETGYVIGLDGRKMSKSYNNTIPLFLPPKKLRKLIMKIVTNSQTIDEPKDPDNCSIFALYKLFSTKEQQEDLRKKYLAGGMGWGHAKQYLFEIMNETLTPIRDKYNQLISDKAYIDEVLIDGAERANEIVSQKMDFIRKEIGLS